MHENTNRLFGANKILMLLRTIYTGNLAGKLSIRLRCLIKGSLIKVMCVHLCLKAGNQLQMPRAMGAMRWSGGIAVFQGTAVAIPCSLPAPLSFTP